MRSSDQPRQDAGYAASLILAVMVFLGFMLAVSWYQRKVLETQLLQEQLVTRLEHELPREVERVVAQLRAAGSIPDRQMVEAQAFINLHTRARREMVALENDRQRMKQLMAGRVEVREQLSRLSLEVRRAQMWVMMLEQRLKSMPRVQPQSQTGSMENRRCLQAHPTAAA